VSHLTQSELPAACPVSAPWLHALPLWQAVVLAALSLWLYGPTLIHLVRQWWHDPNFSHGFFVPAFSAFVVWQGRTRLAQIPLKPSWTGAGILALALAVLVIGQTGAELFLARLSLLLLLSSLIVLFLGWNHLRALLFPLAFLVLMIPIPTIVFNQITFPLQLLASWLSAGVLQWLGVPVLREGNVIVLPAMALEVAEACSGVRSLMSLATLAVIYGYLMDRNIAVRVLLASRGLGAHRGGCEWFADRGNGITGAILGPRQGRGLLSHVLRVADLCGLADHAIPATPSPASNVA